MTEGLTLAPASTEVREVSAQVLDEVPIRVLAPPEQQAGWLQQQLERAWQRQNLQQLAREGLFGCWRADLVQWPRLAETRGSLTAMRLAEAIGELAW